MKVVVGLGNPGDRYRDDRHNVGFRVVEQIALTNHASAWSQRFDGLLVDCRIGAEKTLLFKPMTYMNRSGRAVRRVVDFHKSPVEDLLVVCDDFNLPTGKLRVRSGGSAGGQNGLKDIFAHLGVDQIPRLRLGIGSPGSRDPADFVLSKFSVSERSVIEDAVIEAARAVECWVNEGIQATMNQFNAKAKERNKE